ncbi:MAG: response regulator [Bacteroidota bacterium]
MSKQILVIEDNEEVRDNLAEILELYGYTVTQAKDGIEGVKAAMETPPDLILCDVMMPALDGFGVLNLLGENERTASIPFVFITARTEKEDIRRGMNLGADDYITKPFYKDELLKVVQTRLRKAALRGPALVEARPQPSLSDPERGRGILEKAFVDEGRVKVFDRGEQVIREGDNAHFIYRIKKGRVLLGRSHEYGRDYILAEQGPGEYFGIPSVLEAEPFHYSAKVATATLECELLPKEKFLQLVNQERTVAEALMHLLAGRVVERSSQLVHQAYDSVRRRTALILCDLYERHEGGDIELSREELAQMVGATKESVIRAISDFKRDKLLTTEGRKVRLLDVVALRALLV